MAADFPIWLPFRYKLVTEIIVQMVIQTPALAQIPLLKKNGGDFKFKIASHFPRWPLYRYELATETTVQMVRHAPKWAQMLLIHTSFEKACGPLEIQDGRPFS